MKKNRMKLVKQMLAVVLCLAMVLGSLSLTGEIVLAEGTNACNGDHTLEMYGDDGKCKECGEVAAIKIESDGDIWYDSEKVIIPWMGTVTLLRDVVLEKQVSIDNACDTTIDLGNYTLEYAEEYSSVLSIGNGANVQIKAGETGCIKGYNGIMCSREDTFVTLSGGTIESQASGVLVENGATVTIGGNTKISANDSESSIGVLVVDSGTANICDNVVVSGKKIGIALIDGNLFVNGGTICGENAIGYYEISDEEESIVISGGNIVAEEYEFLEEYSEEWGCIDRNLYTQPVITGGTFPNGVRSNSEVIDLNGLLGEKSAYYDADGKLVNIEDGVKAYTGSLTVKQDTDAPNIYYKLSEDETKGKELDDTKVAAISIAKDDAIILEAQDPISGVTEFKYALTAFGESAPADESEWITYTEPIVCSELGEISLHIKAVDAMQNEKSAQMNLVVCAVPVVEEVTYTYKANKDKVIEVTLNQNSIEGIVWQETELEEGTDYILAVDEISDCAKITLKKEWLDTLVAGETTLQMKYKRNNTSAFTMPLSVDIPVTILEAIPNLGTVTADAIDETESISDIILHRTNTEVAGTLSIDAGQTLAAGTNELSYTFTPTDKNYAVVTGKVKVKVASSYNVELSSEDTTISSTDFSDILKENAARDIVIQSNDKITFTFAKGTMSNVEGKTDYDFGTSICADFASAGTMDENVTKDNFVARINFDYSGKLPATASIQIAVGKEYAGERLYYSKLLENGLKYIMSAVVDAEGTILVQQDSCSDYVLTTEKPVEDKEPTGDNNQTSGNNPTGDNNQTGGNTTTGGNNPVSPKTGDGFVAVLMFIIGITGCVLYGFQSKSKKIKE